VRWLVAAAVVSPARQGCGSIAAKADQSGRPGYFDIRRLYKFALLEDSSNTCLDFIDS
jgi:hypothetical protein